MMLFFNKGIEIVKMSCLIPRKMISIVRMLNPTQTFWIIRKFLRTSGPVDTQR